MHYSKFATKIYINFLNNIILFFSVLSRERHIILKLFQIFVKNIIWVDDKWGEIKKIGTSEGVSDAS